MRKGTKRRGAALLLAGAAFLISESAAQEQAIQAGAVKRGDAWEVGVSFAQPVNRNTAIVSENFSVQGAEILGLRFVNLNGSVVLSVSPLNTNEVYSLSVTNLRTASGAEIPATTVPFAAKDLGWTAVGGQELGFVSDAVAVGDAGFDLISGGVQMQEYYDESTFAFEKVTGNFDRKVRVVMQEGSSFEARAGLMVREVLDSGKSRPGDPENVDEAFSRFIQLHVNPVQTAYSDRGQPVPAANEHQAIARFYTGGIGSPTFEPTELLSLSNNAAPPYPNAWLRIRRVGSTFTLFRGNDGTNWTQLGACTFPSSDVRGPLSSTLFVGPNFSPETGNIPLSSEARRAFLAQFRDYGSAGPSVPSDPPTLNIRRVPNNEIEITWTGGGSLQSSATLAPDSWAPVPNSASPYRTAPAGNHRFYRVQL